MAAIEHIDARSIEVVREDGVDRKLESRFPSGTGVVLLIELELSRAGAPDELWRQLETARDLDAADSPLRRFCALLDRHGGTRRCGNRVAGRQARAAAFAELREAVPAGVNRRVALAQQRIDPRISKTAPRTWIVPFIDSTR